MEVRNTTGKITFLRVNEQGTKYGPGNDELDAEVIVKLANDQQVYGLPLKLNDKLPAAQAMFQMLQDAFNNNTLITIEYRWNPGQNNHILFRVIEKR